MAHSSPQKVISVSAPVTAPVDGSATIATLLHRLTGQLSTLFRQELALAGAEISGSLIVLAVSLASIASGAAILYAGVLLLLFSVVCGLALVMPIWLAALAAGLVVVPVGCVLLIMGLRKLKASQLIPKHSAQSLRRDKALLLRNST